MLSPLTGSSRAVNSQYWEFSGRCFRACFWSELWCCGARRWSSRGILVQIVSGCQFWDVCWVLMLWDWNMLQRLQSAHSAPSVKAKSIKMLLTIEFSDSWDNNVSNEKVTEDSCLTILVKDEREQSIMPRSRCCYDWETAEEKCIFQERSQCLSIEISFMLQICLVVEGLNYLNISTCQNH